MSNGGFLTAGAQAGLSRSPSSTSASDVDQEEESADESDLELTDDPSNSHLHLHLNPALVTPKATAQSAMSPWPYTSADQVSPALALFPPLQIPASSLPHEILLSILKLLPGPSLSPALLVCKAWCQCGVELLWHKPSFTNLSSLFRMLLVISASQPLSPDAPEEPAAPDDMDFAPSSEIGTTFPYPSFIRRLNFSSLSDEMSDKILAKFTPCSYLERLTLAGCTALSSAALISIVTSCDRLVAIDLSDVMETVDEVLEAVAENCERLQGLNLTGCTQVTDRGVEAIARGCPGLRRIKLRSVALLTDTPIVLLSLLCPLLLEVDLVACPRITSVALFQLFSTSHHLRELSLASCTEVDDEAFPSLNIDWNMSDDETPVGELVMTTNGTTLQMPIPLRHHPALKQFDHLRYLDLTSLSLLTDDAVAGIVKYAPRIRNLILTKCVGLTDDAVLSICALGKHLHYLHMGHVGGITDRAVTRLARSCTRLRYIDLACCTLLTDMSVFELATNLPRLKRIGLVRVANLTDQAIYALFARPSLERIHLSYCENVTIQAIHDLLQHLPRVTHLSLTGVPAFRRTDLQTWCRTPPRDFNSHQRQSFCVYSGKGVQELRRYLRSISATAPPNAGNGIIVDDDLDDDTTVRANGQPIAGARIPRAHRPRAATTQDANTRAGLTIPPHNPTAGRHFQPIPTRRNVAQTTPTTAAAPPTNVMRTTRTRQASTPNLPTSSQVPIHYVPPTTPARSSTDLLDLTGNGVPDSIPRGHSALESPIAPLASGSRSRSARDGPSQRQEEVASWLQGQGRAPAPTAYGSEAAGGPGSGMEPNAWSWAGGEGSAVAGTSDGSGRARASTVTRRNYIRQGAMEMNDDAEEEEGEGSSVGDDDVEMG